MEVIDEGINALVRQNIYELFRNKSILTPAYPSYLPDPFFAQRSMLFGHCLNLSLVLRLR